MKRTSFALLLLLFHPLLLAAQQPGGEPDTLPRRAPTVGAAAHADSFSVSERTSAETFSELLAGQVPGLVVQRFSGTAGAASRLELRGPATVGLRGQPLLVIDGLRAISEEQSLFSNVGGGASLSSYDDIDPDMVESVTVLPGPAAAARYGPAAANGVLEVRTRRGALGRPRWRAFAEAGLREDAGGYPANFAQVGRNFDGERNANCDLLFQSGGVCTPLADSLRSFNPLEQSSPFRTGSRLGAGVSVDGGTGLVSYSAGLGFGHTVGVQEENDDGIANARASVAVRPLAGVEVRVSAAHLRREVTPVVEGPTLLSVLAGGLLGSADSASGNGGYHPAFRRDFDVWDGSHAVRRTLAGAEAAWAPFGWLTLGARYGIDQADRDESTRLELSPPVSGAVVGTVEREREVRTAGADATVRLRLPGGLDSRTSLGVERVSERASFFFREDIPGGLFNERETRSRRAVLGVSLRQVLRAGPLAVEAGVRRDEPRDQDELWSGSAGAAWTVGRAAEWLDGIRLRAALGRTERSLESVPGVDGPEILLIACPAGDDCGLEPQKSTEAEAGVDARLLGRVEVRLTGYVRDDSDVFLLEGSVAGARPGTEVRNTGAELSIRAPVVERPAVAWDVELLGWTNRNRVTARPEGAPPIIGPNGGRIREGRPLGAYFDRPIVGFDDRDRDGIIDRLGCPGATTCEVELGDTAAYLGSPHPTRMLALASRLRLGERVTLSARLEHQGGAKLLNRIGMLRCAAFRSCREVVDRDAPLGDQARAAAAQLGSDAGYVEDADFVKLREVAVTFSAPDAWSRRIGAAGVELTVAGRNLVTWTSYGGLDPEINTLPGSPFERVDFGTQPLARTVTTRVELRF